MSKHSITLKRDGTSHQTVGTDGFNALQSIQGVEEVEIMSESNEQVELTYSWGDDGKFWEADERLAEYGLARVDIK